MKKIKNRCGAALLEVLISIAILGLLAVPISSAILTSIRINAQSSELMQARLAVSSAAETIMASGIDSAADAMVLDLPDVDIENVVPPGNKGYWTLTIRSEDFDNIFVSVRIRSNDVRNLEGGSP